MGKLQNYINEVKEELSKVSWPTKDSTIGTTFVVVIICIICAFYLGVVDFGLTKLTSIIY